MNFSRFMFLCSLASAAGFGNEWMKAGVKLDASNPAALMHSLQELQVQMAQTGGGDQSPDPALEDALSRFSAGAGDPAAADEAQQFAKELRAGAGFSNAQAPVLQKLMRSMEKGQGQVQSAPDQAWEAWMKAQALYLQAKPWLKPWLWRVPLLFSFLALGSFLMGRIGWSRGLSDFGYGWGVRWLLLLSVGAAAVSLLTRSNAWALVPRELIVPPLIWILASAGTLRLVDMNYPVWNSVFQGTLAPLASMGLVLLLPKLASLLPGLG